MGIATYSLEKIPPTNIPTTLPLQIPTMSLRHCCITVLFLLGSVHAATLEELFEQKQFAEFQPKALAAAEQGDAQALFLLGKAHHLHLIKTPDAPDYVEAEELALAQAYYEQARAGGYARASHNLGLLLIDQGMKREGIALLEEALARGLKVPTLQVLARAVAPEADYLVYPSTIADSGKSGDYFAAALAAQPEQHALENDAAGQYLRAYLYYLKARDDVQAEFDRNTLRQRAISWLDKGRQRNDAIAWTNYGVLLMEEARQAGSDNAPADFAPARAALARGAELNNPVAHFQLAELAYEGRGLPERDLALALQHYEAAALLGLKQAVQPARHQLEEALRYETDLVKLEAGIARLAALQKIDPKTFAYPDELLAERLAWGRLLAAEQASPPVLPALPLELNLCGMGMNQSAGLAYNLSEGLEWWLAVFEQMDEPVKLAVSGRIDNKGCIRARGKALETLRPYLQRGAIAALAFPGSSLPLTTRSTGKAIRLELRGPDTPQPQY